MKESSLIPLPEASPATLERPRAHEHPVIAYLARLRGERARTVQRQALAVVAGCVANEHRTGESGRPTWQGGDPLTFPWPQLTYSVTSAIRGRLRERYAP